MRKSKSSIGPVVPAIAVEFYNIFHNFQKQRRALKLSSMDIFKIQPKPNVRSWNYNKVDIHLVFLSGVSHLLCQWIFSQTWVNIHFRNALLISNKSTFKPRSCLPLESKKVSSKLCLNGLSSSGRQGRCTRNEPYIVLRENIILMCLGLLHTF